MTRRRRLAIGAVLLFVAIAAAVIVAPDRVPGSVAARLEAVGSQAVLRGLGVVLVLASGGRFLLGSLAGSPQTSSAGETETPDRMQRRSPEVVGEQLDAQLEALSKYHSDARAGVVAHDLRPIGVELVARVRGVDVETAREQLETGSWTEDPRAAAFFATEPVAVPLRYRILDRLADEPVEYRRARHAIDELLAYRRALERGTDRPLSSADRPDRADPFQSGAHSVGDDSGDGDEPLQAASDTRSSTRRSNRETNESAGGGGP